MRKAALGLSDEQTGRHNLSDMHFQLLEAVGKLRRRGGYQSELAKAMKMPAGNFFYIMKVSF